MFCALWKAPPYTPGRVNVKGKRCLTIFMWVVLTLEGPQGSPDYALRTTSPSHWPLSCFRASSLDVLPQICVWLPPPTAQASVCMPPPPRGLSWFTPPSSISLAWFIFSAVLYLGDLFGYPAAVFRMEKTTPVESWSVLFIAVPQHLALCLHSVFTRWRMSPHLCFAQLGAVPTNAFFLREHQKDEFSLGP